MNIFKSAPLILLAVFIAGCAGQNKRDPYENYNRGVDAFNEGADKALIKPLAHGYKAITPPVVRTGLGNAFRNLGQPRYMVHDIVQGKPKDFLEHTQRFLFNSTFGLLGMFDTTDTFRLPPEKANDMGMTFARYGWKNSDYFILPLMGPGTVRDSTGRVVDVAIDPRNYVFNGYANAAISITQLAHFRAQMFEVEDVAARAALDPYIFKREAYIQYRQNQLIKAGLISELSTHDDDELSIHELAKQRNKRN